jgi:peptidoglycan/xylan/chitin deacetylase (PgdA/CDA1 family)
VVGDRLVLCYHDVVDGPSTGQTVTSSSLQQQVGGLVRRGYLGVTFGEAMGAASSRLALAVTFDDGLHNVLRHAAPVLAELEVPGTVFVAVGPVGAPGLLGWDDLTLLRDAGWEVGSHTVSHARLTELDDKALEGELVDSRRAIESRLGTACRSIAYPYGDADDRVRAAAAAAGYTAGCTTEGTLGADVLGWPRVGVDGGDGRVVFRVKTSRAGRAVRGTRLRAALDRAGRLARRL